MPQSSIIKKFFNSKKSNTDKESVNNTNESTAEKKTSAKRFSSMLQKYLCGCSGKLKNKRDVNKSQENIMIPIIQEELKEGSLISNKDDQTRVKMKLLSVKVTTSIEQLNETKIIETIKRSSVKRNNNTLHPTMAYESSYPKLVTSNNILTDRGCLVNIRTGSFNLGTENVSQKSNMHQVPSFNVSLHDSDVDKSANESIKQTTNVQYLNVFDTQDNLRRSSHDPTIEKLHKNYINNIKLLNVPTPNTSVATLSDASFFNEDSKHNTNNLLNVNKIQIDNSNNKTIASASTGICNSKSAEVLLTINDLTKVNKWLTDSNHHHQYNKSLSVSFNNILNQQQQQQQVTKKRRVTYKDDDETYGDAEEDLDDEDDVEEEDDDDDNYDFEYIDKEIEDSCKQQKNEQHETNDSAVDVGGSQDSISTSVSSKSRTHWKSFTRKYHSHFFHSTTWSKYQMSAMSLAQFMILRKLALIQFSHLIEAQQRSLIKTFKIFTKRNDEVDDFKRTFFPEDLIENDSVYLNNHIPSTPTSPLTPPNSASQANYSIELKRAIFRSKTIISNTNKHIFDYSISISNILVDKVNPQQIDKNVVFGVPLKKIMRQTGQPLPQRIIESMKMLRKAAPRALGIFRKNGNKLRIKQLKEAIDTNENFNMKKMYSLYDIADTLKLYFRELPECLITNRLSEILLTNYGRMNIDERKLLLQQAMLLISDENRLALQTLLLFLNDVARHHKTNEMNRTNLAICFSPILFHFNLNPKQMKKMQKLSSIQQSTQEEDKDDEKVEGDAEEADNDTNSDDEIPRKRRQSRKMSRKKSQRPTPPSSSTVSDSFKDYVDNIAKIGQMCVADMIKYCMDLFTVPIENFEKLKLSSLHDTEPFHLDYYFDQLENRLKREEFFTSLFNIHSSNWSYFDKYEDVSIYFGKNALNELKSYTNIYDKIKLWKCCTLIKQQNLNFEKIIQRLRHERVLWDDDYKEGKIINQLNENTCIFKYVIQLMPPHPSRDFTEIQHLHKHDDNTFVLTSASIQYDDSLIGDIKANTILSKYIIEKLVGNNTVTTFKITHLIKVDYRGFTSEFYNQTFGHINARLLHRLRSSLSFY